MNNEKKAKSLWYNFCTEKTCNGHNSCENCPKSKPHDALLQIAQWKDEQIKETLKKSIKWFDTISDMCAELTSGNVSHKAAAISGMAIRSSNIYKNK